MAESVKLPLSFIQVYRCLAPCEPLRRSCSGIAIGAFTNIGCPAGEPDEQLTASGMRFAQFPFGKYRPEQVQQIPAVIILEDALSYFGQEAVTSEPGVEVFTGSPSDFVDAN